MLSEIISSIILGIIQGLGEFLPISSSGHLVILHDVFNLTVGGKNELAFDTALHFGTFFAVLFYFKNPIINFIKNDLIGLVKKKNFSIKNLKQNSKFRLLLFLGFATIPGGLAGVFFEDIIDSILRDPKIVVFTLIFYGLLLYLADKINEKKLKAIKKNKVKNLNKQSLLNKINLKKALLIGTAQALALIPGTSRSGVTITAGLFLGLNRQQSAKFSFLLSMPIILSASLVQLPKLIGQSEINIITVLLGIFSAFIVGFLSIKYMLKYLSKKSYNVFVIYRIVLALLILGFLFFK
jgi:undecaprenyl-diphosphatase